MCEISQSRGRLCVIMDQASPEGSPMKIWKIAALVVIATVPVILMAARKPAPVAPEYQEPAVLEPEDPFETALHAA